LKTTRQSGHLESVLIDPISSLTNKPWVRLTYVAQNWRQWGYVWTTNLARQSGNNRSAPRQHRCALGLQMHTRLSHSVPPPCFVGRLCEHASEEQKTGGLESSEQQWGRVHVCSCTCMCGFLSVVACLWSRSRYRALVSVYVHECAACVYEYIHTQNHLETSHVQGKRRIRRQHWKRRIW